jgi:membrane dipeptidase
MERLKIDRRMFVRSGLIATVLTSRRGATLAAFATQGEKPTDVYSRAIVVDTMSFDKSTFDPHPLLDAGVTALVLDLFNFPRDTEHAIAELDNWGKAFSSDGSLFCPIRTAADFAQAKEQKKLGIVLASHDANILGPPNYSISNINLETLQILYQKKLRVLQLTYTDANGLGSGYAEPHDAGLTRLGRAVVQEMNRLGMLIDVSHCGEKTTLDAISDSKHPIAITHAGCFAVYRHPRNKSDAIIRKLAEHGGYLGVYNSTLWMTDSSAPTVQDIVNHIDHVVKVGGIDLVGFGSDQLALGDPRPQGEKVAGMQQFVSRTKGWPGTGPSHGQTTASDLDHPDRCRVLADALARRGYPSRNIEKILGGNFVRTFGVACG